VKQNKQLYVSTLGLYLLLNSPLCAEALPWDDHLVPDWAMQQNYEWTDDLMLDDPQGTGASGRVGASGRQSKAKVVSVRPATYRQVQRPTFSHAAAQREGLKQLQTYLQRQNPRQKVGKAWANLSNAALMQTVNALLGWDYTYQPSRIAKQFELRIISSSQRVGEANYTGYFTPIIDVRRQPDRQYRYPIYAAPQDYHAHLSRREIAAGALRGNGLELAWTNDIVNLFFAHIQGSAIARFADGRKRLLSYAGNNKQPYRSISRYLRTHCAMKGSLSNSNIRRWLHRHPQRIREVLDQNPRYVFFQWADKRPKTAMGSLVIPWHTVAVDDKYIPLGAVLLAEVPRINAQGEIEGQDWRLLFAQDRGSAIKGPGRLDLYTGAGQQAEQATYRLTGFRKTYLLVRRKLNGATANYAQFEG